MQTIKQGSKYIVCFLCTVAVLTGLLVCSALIPRSAIKDNTRESAEYLCENKLFGTLTENVEGSKLDRYADSILLGIAYQYDREHPLTSVMWSSWYHVDYKGENANLLEAVTNEYEPNQQYLRYWHGSNVIVRLLLLWFNLKEIYIINGVILAVLVVSLLALLLRNKAFVPAVGVAAGLIITAVWCVPFSLEYIWTYLLMLLFSIIGFRLAIQNKWEKLGFFFLIAGMITNYLDFLTTETLTLLIPLLLIVWVYRHNHPAENLRSLFQNAAKSVVMWGIGYVGMWLMKWIMASVVLGENVMPYVSEHVKERLGGNIGLDFWHYVIYAVWQNVKCLFPFEYGVMGVACGVFLLLFVIYIGYVYHKRHICKECIVLYALLGIIPYIRYMVLHNHAYLHFFFTYRAQMATVLAVVLILEELTERRWQTHAHVRKRMS